MAVVYVPLWTRNTVTGSVNTGFFERQPATKPGTTCVQPVTNPCRGGGNGLHELHELNSYIVIRVFSVFRGSILFPLFE